ncbi:MAG: threonine synthase, partial [Actinomycetes bacterium]
MTATDSPPVLDDLTFDFGPAVGLVCRECAAQYSLGAAYACMECFGPLEVRYEFGTVTREQIEAGPSSLWRYSPLVPVSARAADELNLAPGCTRLLRSNNLAAELGIKTLWIKDDSGNPTHSFKD